MQLKELACFSRPFGLSFSRYAYSYFSRISSAFSLFLGLLPYLVLSYSGVLHGFLTGCCYFISISFPVQAFSFCLYLVMMDWGVFVGSDGV
jgi:hypothetical protein